MKGKWRNRNDRRGEQKQDQGDESARGAEKTQKEVTPESGPVDGNSDVRMQKLYELCSRLLEAEEKKATKRAQMYDVIMGTQDESVELQQQQQKEPVKTLHKAVGAAKTGACSNEHLLKTSDEFVSKELYKLRQEVEKLHARQYECFYTTLQMIEKLRSSFQGNVRVGRNASRAKAIGSTIPEHPMSGVAESGDSFVERVHKERHEMNKGFW
ncbi:hypothetical protein CAEBREN_04793 [Caenorhabditis brenneri]|uniref:Uncharacterized protein n=1 Tax=Caenorhabditis brenneri TaxID=135651 RepID=G0NZT5_CAEBE|nr:hypothetical protein CAEBREN_04793 [Caenorhabditis brenneri]